MDIKQLVQSLTYPQYENLRTALELGKWPDGNRLSEEQRENTMQLVIAYQSHVLKSEEHMAVGGNGELNIKSKAELKKQFAIKDDSENNDSEDNQGIARFGHEDI